MLANDRSFCLLSRSTVSMLLNVATCRAQQLQFALTVTAAVLTAFEQLFGVPFTLPKLDLVAIPDFGAGAMENWGLITYRCAALVSAPWRAGGASPTSVLPSLWLHA